jgi:hypothetical protein
VNTVDAQLDFTRTRRRWRQPRPSFTTWTPEPVRPRRASLGRARGNRLDETGLGARLPRLWTAQRGTICSYEDFGCLDVGIIAVPMFTVVGFGLGWLAFMLSCMVGPPNFLAIMVFASTYGIASFVK